MSRRTGVALAAAGVTVVLAGCSALGGGEELGAPTYVAPSTTTTAPSGETEAAGDQPVRLPLARELLPKAKAQAGATETVTIRATMPLTGELADLGPLHVTSTGSTGGNRTDVRITMSDGSSLEQRDLGKGELYLRLETGDVQEAFDIERTDPLVRRSGRWVRIYSFEPKVELRPYDIIRSSFTGGELDPIDMKYGVVDARQLDGEQVLGVLVRPVGSESKDVVRTMWVTREEPHRFLRYEAGAYPAQKTITFSDWGTTRLPSERPKGAVKAKAEDVLG